MGNWLSVGAVLGAVVYVVVGRIFWPPQFNLDIPSLIRDTLTDPTSVMLGRAGGGALLGILLAAIAVVFWDTVALSAWLLRWTTAPLGKVALGLGLIFNGFLLTLLSNVAGDIHLTPTLVLKVPLLLKTAGTLLTVVGPILCLEFAPKTRSSGILLWAVAFSIASLVIGANPVLNELKFGNGTFYWAGLLGLAALPLYLVFFKRLSRTLERDDLERPRNRCSNSGPGAWPV